MNHHFQALPMSVRDAKEAYPLIYLHDASISLAEWLDFARRRCRQPTGRTGMIGIRDRRGVIHSVFVYRIDIDLHARKQLRLQNLVVARTPGSTIDEAILSSANALAARHACKTISLEQPFSRRVGLPGTCPTALDLFLNRAGQQASTSRH
jgi:hypothetical protein